MSVPSDHPENVPEDHPGISDHEKVRTSLIAPAIMLILSGSFSVLFACPFELKMIDQCVRDLSKPVKNDPSYVAGYLTATVCFMILPFLWIILIITGAIQMLRLRGYRFARLGSIMALFPCGLCWPLSLPAGIWALIVLHRPSAKRAFDPRSTHQDEW